MKSLGVLLGALVIGTLTLLGFKLAAFLFLGAVLLSVLLIAYRFLAWIVDPSSRAAAKREEERIRNAQARELEAWHAARVKAEREERENARRAQEQRERHRDADTQVEPYTYEIDRHANEALAIRYGIANLKNETREYVYTGKGGEQRRNPTRDRTVLVPASTIRLRKTKKLRDDHYQVELTDHGNRLASAVIEPGTEAVKTFYPIEPDWFVQQAALETALKSNGTFSLKELAAFHVQSVIRASRTERDWRG